MNYRINNSPTHVLELHSVLFWCRDCICSFRTYKYPHTMHSHESLPVRTRVCCLCFGRPQSDWDSLLIPIFQLEVSRAWLAAAGAQLQSEDREEGKTNRNQGRGGSAEMSFHFLGCSVVLLTGKCGGMHILTEFGSRIWHIYWVLMCDYWLYIMKVNNWKIAEPLLPSAMFWTHQLAPKRDPSSPVRWRQAVNLIFHLFGHLLSSSLSWRCKSFMYSVITLDPSTDDLAPCGFLLWLKG